MKPMKQIVMPLLAALAVAMPAFGADIQLSVDAASNTITLTNNLPQAVHIAALGSSAGFVGVSADLPAGGSATIANRAPLPVVAVARAFPLGKGAKLADRVPDKSGLYELSVAVR